MAKLLWFPKGSSLQWYPLQLTVRRSSSFVETLFTCSDSVKIVLQLYFLAYYQVGGTFGAKWPLHIATAALGKEPDSRPCEHTHTLNTQSRKSLWCLRNNLLHDNIHNSLWVRMLLYVHLHYVVMIWCLWHSKKPEIKSLREFQNSGGRSTTRKPHRSKCGHSAAILVMPLGTYLNRIHWMRGLLCDVCDLTSEKIKPAGLAGYCNDLNLYVSVTTEIKVVFIIF